MADYYPLIARAVSGLDPGAPGEARRALYERARAALIAQLRSVEPPLTESEITRERLALEEAVRKVESEAAQRARIEPPKADSLGRTRPGDALRSSVRTRTPPSDTAGRERPAPPRPEEPAAEDPSRSIRPQRPEPPPAEPRRETRPQPPAIGMTEPKLDPRGEARPDQRQAQRLDPRPDQRPEAKAEPRPPSRERAAPPRRGAEGERPQQGGLRGFRDVVADANDLGGAAAQASRAARRAYANVPSPSPEFDRLEPTMENRLDPSAENPYAYDDALLGDELYQDRIAGTRPTTVKARGPSRAPKPLRTAGRFPLKSALALGLVLVMVGVGFLVGPKLWSMVRGMSQPVAEAPKAAVADSGIKPKITDRVGQPGSTQIAPVAQKVVLYDEDPSDPQGKRYTGTVVWRTDQVPGTNGQPPDVAVRADIDVPDRKLKMTLSIRRNTDASLPASHTAELTFSLPADFAGGGVGNVPGILMKSNEQTKGTPLAGLAVKVTDGFFLIGLSNVDTDKARNIQLLKERSWFDIPLVYTNQRRAILAIEKGAPGERAFADAFAAWGQ